MVLAAAIRVPALVSTMLAAMPEEHERGLGGWHAEWETLPEIFLLAAGALSHTTQIVNGLEVHEEKMAHNLAATHGLILAEAVAIALAKHMGRMPAHHLIEKASHQALESGRTLRGVLLEEKQVREHLSAAEIEMLLDPRNYTGSAESMIERGWRIIRSSAKESIAQKATDMPFIDANGTRFNYQIDGPVRAPVIVFSNSLGTTLSMWDSQVPALSQKFRVVRYDMRGHGLTTVTPGPYTIEGLARDVVGLLDALKIERAHFCGISIGGALGQWLGVGQRRRSFQSSRAQ